MVGPASSYSSLVTHISSKVERSKDGSSNPDRVFSLWWSNDLNFIASRSKSFQFCLQTRFDLWEHSGSSRKDGVLVEIFTDINVALHDGVECQFVDTLGFFTNDVWFEKNFRTSESLSSYGNDVSVGEFVLLFNFGTILGCIHVIVVVQ